RGGAFCPTNGATWPGLQGDFRGCPVRRSGETQSPRPAVLYLTLTGDCVRYAVSVRAAPVMAAVFKFAGVTLPEAAAWAALDTAPPTRAAASPFIHNAKLFMKPSRRNTRCITASA